METIRLLKGDRAFNIYSIVLLLFFSCLYISLAHGIVGLALFVSPLGGAIVDWLGFEPLFLFALICGLVAVILSLGLGEPRKALASVD